MITVRQGPNERLITLLGDARPNVTATLHGKLGGYLAKIRVDRGDVVKAGDTLAIIESSRNRQTTYASSLADLENKKRLAERAAQLYDRRDTSQQAYDQAQPIYMSRPPVCRARHDEVAFRPLQAPFDASMITARFIDPGALVSNAGANMTSSQPVLTIADMSEVALSTSMSSSATCRSVACWRRRRCFGRIAFRPRGEGEDRAHLGDSSTRARGRCSPNWKSITKTGFWCPAASSYVTLYVPIESFPEVPAAALITRGVKTFVADVGDDMVVHIHPVVLAHSDGMAVALRQGVTVGQRVALNVPGRNRRRQPSAAREFWKLRHYLSRIACA